jgi:hypothetical protein
MSGFKSKAAASLMLSGVESIHIMAGSKASLHKIPM